MSANSGLSPYAAVCIRMIGAAGACFRRKLRGIAVVPEFSPHPERRISGCACGYPAFAPALPTEEASAGAAAIRDRLGGGVGA